MLARFPRLYVAVQRHRRNAEFRRAGRPWRQGGELSDETQIVIDGFPRSANSWTVRVFLHWQESRVRVSHHQHSEAHIIEACRRNLPVIALIRDPVEAICSFSAMQDGLDPKRALAQWKAFYKAIDRVADKVVIATFEQATTDLGAVVRRVNAKFGTTFTTGKTDTQLFDEITSAMNANSWPGPDRREALNGTDLQFPPAKLDEAQQMFDRLEAIAHASD